MAFAVNNGSPHLAASAADVRVVAEPCQIRGEPAKGRGVVVVGSIRGDLKRPDHVTLSLRHRVRSRAYFSASKSHWSSKDRPKRGYCSTSLPLPITSSK